MENSIKEICIMLIRGMFYLNMFLVYSVISFIFFIYLIFNRWKKKEIKIIVNRKEGLVGVG